MAKHDGHERARRFYQEQGPSGRRHVAADITEQVLDQLEVDPKGLYRFLLNDETALAPGDRRSVEEALEQADHVFGLESLIERQEFRTLMAEVLGERVQRYALDTHSGLYRDRLASDGRYVTAAERAFEMLSALKARVEADRVWDTAGEVPDHLPDDLASLLASEPA